MLRNFFIERFRELLGAKSHTYQAPHWLDSDLLIASQVCISSSHMIVDFHNHFYPKVYLEELAAGDSTGRHHATVRKDNLGRTIVEYSGDYNVIAGAHVDLESRLRAMKKVGIDMQVLTLTTPGVESESIEKARKLARLTNDEFGAITEKHPDEFTALATLPMQSAADAVEEFERAVKECGLRGAMIFSNVCGRPLDSAEFIPVFEKAVKLDVPLFIHPTTPINSTAMEDYRLVPIMGFGVDTTLALLRLVFGGIFERLPDLKLVITHTGGVFPFLRGRIEAAYEAYPECKVRLHGPPSDSLRKVWIDTVCYDTDILTSAYAFSGENKVMLGTDFPHQISDLDRAVSRVRAMKVGEDEKGKILGENALRLLKL